MAMRSTAISQNDEPVLRFTAHSMGSAWHKATIMARIVAWRMVSGIDIIAAMPAYVPADAPEINATADAPGKPRCTNTGCR